MHRLFRIMLLALVAGLCAPLHAQPPREQKVLMLVGEGFNTEEFWQPYYALQGAGYTVTIAGGRAGNIEAGSKTRDLDVPADLSVDDVKPADYLGLVIPGGHGPANLEAFPNAIKMPQTFLAAGQPVAAICHGPRLLGRSGALKGRVATALWKVKDEVPDEWTRGSMGTYLDQAIVIDGNLLTSRYPLDAVPFSRSTLEHLANAGGIALPRTHPRLLVINPKTDRLTGWAFIWGGILAQGIDVQQLPPTQIEALRNADGYDPNAYDMLLILPGAEAAKLADNAAMKSLVADFAARTPHPLVAIGDAADAVRAAGAPSDRLTALTGDRGSMLRRVTILAHAAAAQRPAAASTDGKPIALADATLHLEPGFNGRIAAAVTAYLHAIPQSTLVAGASAGWMRSREGMPEHVDRVLDARSPNAAALPGCVITITDSGLDIAGGKLIVGDTDHAPALVALAQHAAGKAATPATKGKPACIALFPGFDDQVVAAMHAWLSWKGYDVRLVAAAPGVVRGSMGLELNVAAHTYDATPPAANALVVAPGGIWPGSEDSPEAQKRTAWLRAQSKTGAMLVGFGFDNLRIAADPQFKGIKFASSDQTRWSFGKDGGSYTDGPALLSTPRLITAKGFAAIGDALRLLDAAIAK